MVPGLEQVASSKVRYQWWQPFAECRWALTDICAITLKADEL